MTNYAERAIFALGSLQFAGIILEVRASVMEKKGLPKATKNQSICWNKIEFLRNCQMFNDIDNCI